MVQQVGVEAQVFVFEPLVQQLADVEDFKSMGYFGFEESIDEKIVEQQRNLQSSLFEWLRLGNFGLRFESKD